MNSNTACSASSRVRSRTRSMSSHSKVAKKDSHIALSYASPTLPTDGCTPASRHRLPKAIEVYCGFRKLWPHRFQKFCPPQGGAEWGNSITALETQRERRSHIRQLAGMVMLN